MKPLRVVNWARFLGVPALAVLLLVWCVFACAVFLVDEPAKCWAIYVMVGAGGLISHAGHRAHRRNPATNWRYSEWLKLTPWEWGRPLPLGAVRLSLADGLLVLLFATLFPFGWWYGLVIGVVAFAIGYLATVVQSAIAHDEPVLSYGTAVLFGLGVAFSFGPQGPTFAPLIFALLGALLLSQFTLPRVLHRFDELEIARSTPLTKAERKPFRDPTLLCGSPWVNLLEAPGEPSSETPRDRASLWWLKSAAAVAWLFACCEIARQRLLNWAAGADPQLLMEDTTLWGGLKYVCYTMGVDAPNESVRDAATAATAGPMAGFLLLGLICLTLVAERVSGHWPPINPLGRIATGQWIIPGYDYIFLGPLVSLLVYAAVAGLLVATNALGVFAGGAAFAAALPPLMRLTPSMEEWRYTGHHRVFCSRPSPDRR